MRRLAIAVLVALGALAALHLSRPAAERRGAARASPDPEASPPPATSAANAGEPSRPEQTRKVVRVQVLDAVTRRPIVGATVVSGADCAATGADGYASVTLDRDEGLRAWARGFVPSKRLWSGAYDDDLWIPLRQGIPVLGRVVHADGTPAVRAEVKVEGLRMVQDERGQFEIPGVALGEEVRVWAGEEGYHPAEMKFTAAEDRTTFEIVLGSGRACEGIVIDEEGRPVAGARVVLVELYHDRTAGCHERVSCLTDKNGRFSILGLPPLYPGVPYCAPGPPPLDDRHRVRVTTADFRSGETPTFTADPDAPPHTCAIVVSPAAHVVLELTYPDGTPITDARVRFGRDNAQHRAPTEYWSGPVAAGELKITVEVRGWAEQTFAIDVQPRVRNDVTLRLEEGKGLAGTVVDGGGRPLGNISVHFDDASTTTGADGTFRLRGLGAEEGTLEFLGDGYTDESLEVRPGQPPVRVVLDARVPMVKGRIGPPPPGRHVSVDYGHGESLDGGDVAYVDRDGSFEISMPVGKYSLRIEVDGSAPWVFPDIETARGATIDLGVLRMHDGVTVKGEVVDRDDAVVFAHVFVHSAARYIEWYYTSTDEWGRFAISRLPDTPLTLRVESGSHVTQSLEIQRPAEGKPLKIVLDPGGVLEIAGATEPVTVEPLDGGESRTLPPGERRVQLRPGRYRVAGRVVEIKVGETTEIDLRK